MPFWSSAEIWLSLVEPQGGGVEGDAVGDGGGGGAPVDVAFSVRTEAVQYSEATAGHFQTQAARQSYREPMRLLHVPHTHWGHVVAWHLVHHARTAPFESDFTWRFDGAPVPQFHGPRRSAYCAAYCDCAACAVTVLRVLYSVTVRCPACSVL